MTSKGPILAGVSRAAFFASPTAHPMLRGPQVAYAPEDDSGAAAAPVETPAADPPAPEAAAADGGGTDDPPAAPPPADDPPPPPPKKKDTEAVLKGRVGYLTKSLSVKEEAYAELQRQNEALTALLNAQQGGGDHSTGHPPAAAQPPSQPPRGVVPGTPEFQAAVQAEAANQAFQAEADRVNAEGRQKHGADWEESLGALGAMGILQRPFVEAAFASGAPTEVLTALGQDLEEATRIASLPPIRMAAELARMAARTPAPAARPVSAAPPPIRPVGSAVNPQIDIEALAKGNDMAAYVAARKAQGSLFAR